jgi:hypothetical protein
LIDGVALPSRQSDKIPRHLQTKRNLNLTAAELQPLETGDHDGAVEQASMQLFSPA